MAFILPGGMMSQMQQTLESKEKSHPKVKKTEKEGQKLKFLKNIRELQRNLTTGLHNTDALLTMINDDKHPSWSELGLNAKQGEAYKKHLMSVGRMLVELIKAEKEFPTVAQTLATHKKELDEEYQHHHH